VHDLAVYLPEVFVPAFTELLPSVCANLLAPTVGLRVQAAQALGGFAYALSSMGSTALHARASAYIAEFLTTPPESDAPAPPGSPGRDALIVRTLRTTMAAADAGHPAHGPQWAACTLAACAAILGSRAYSEPRVGRILTGLLNVCMKHRKSTVRALCCAVWRVLTWVYFQPPLPPDEDVAEDEDGSAEEDEDAARARRRAYDAHIEETRGRFWDTIQTVYDMGAGAALVAALLGDVHDVRTDEASFTEAVQIVHAMARKRGALAREAAAVLQQLLSPFALADEALEEAQDVRTALGAWDAARLLTPQLFCAGAPGGLLTTELSALSGAVRPMLDDAAGVDDIRWLTPEELASEPVFAQLLGLWKAIAIGLPWPKDNNMDNLLHCWRALFAPAIKHLQEADGTDADIARIAHSAARVVVALVQDMAFGANGAPDAPDARTCLAGKWFVVEGMWARMRSAVPATHARACAPTLQAALLSNYGGLEDDADALAHWARACAAALVLGEQEDTEAFFERLRDNSGRGFGFDMAGRLAVWTQFAEVYSQDAEATLEQAVYLLGGLHASVIGIQYLVLELTSSIVSRTI
jgi:hypothetical protein